MFETMEKIIEDHEEIDENHSDILENHGKIGENQNVANTVQIDDFSYSNLRF